MTDNAREKPSFGSELKNFMHDVLTRLTFPLTNTGDLLTFITNRVSNVMNPKWQGNVTGWKIHLGGRQAIIGGSIIFSVFWCLALPIQVLEHGMNAVSVYKTKGFSKTPRTRAYLRFALEVITAITQGMAYLFIFLTAFGLALGTAVAIMPLFMAAAGAKTLYEACFTIYSLGMAAIGFYKIFKKEQDKKGVYHPLEAEENADRPFTPTEHLWLAFDHGLNTLLYVGITAAIVVGGFLGYAKIGAVVAVTTSVIIVGMIANSILSGLSGWWNRKPARVTIAEKLNQPTFANSYRNRLHVLNENPPKRVSQPVLPDQSITTRRMAAVADSPVPAAAAIPAAPAPQNQKGSFLKESVGSVLNMFALWRSPSPRPDSPVEANLPQNNNSAEPVGQQISVC